MLNLALPSVTRPIETPAGIQPAALVLRRRLFVAAAVSATCATMGYGLFVALGLHEGTGVVGAAIFALGLLACPWYAVGLWNSLIGLWLLQGRRDGLDLAAPFLKALDGAPSGLSVRSAVVMTVRNEDPERALSRLAAIYDSLEATGLGDRFDYFVLSDTSEPSIARKEEALCAAWQILGRKRLFYRRRQSNEGFKAGNLREFMHAQGESYDLALVLDADSLMSGARIVELCRIMQAHPKLGILQSLIVSAPAQSAFARLFQFGMRHSMRSYTMGSAWWTADCGPYWGHNAVLRIAPFRDHCELPRLPGNGPFGGPILSHDLLEAALMRRAGYEVRVLPVEGGSYEDNPPTFVEFAKRDGRWGLGNLQYLRCLRWPGLKAVSRIQIGLAILMYLGTAATTVAVGLAILAAPFGGLSGADAAAAMAVFAAIYLLSATPKLAGLADALLSKGGSERYGGAGLLTVGALTEIVFSSLLSVIMTLRSTLSTVNALLGRKIGWNGQVRDGHGLPWRTAFAVLWPETVLGAAILAWLSAFAPQGQPLALPIIAALCLSAPLAVLTASPRLGALLRRKRICGVPEEFEPSEVLGRLAKPEPERGTDQATVEEARAANAEEAPAAR